MLDSLADHALGLGFGQIARVDPDRPQSLCFASYGVPLAAERLPALVVHQTQFAPSLGQPHVGVVLPQLQAEFGPAGEHAVGLGHALGDQVIHEHAQVGFVAAR